MNIPGPWTLEVLAYFRNNPVINLERNDAPSHALVRGVYLGCSRRETAVVEFELIHSPPRPITVPFCGVFEAHAYAVHDDDETELPWFVFEPTLTLEANIDRLRQHVRDAIRQLGRREAAPLASDEPSFSVASPTSGRGRFVPQRAAAPPAPEPPPSGPQQPLGATIEMPRVEELAARPPRSPDAPPPSGPPRTPPRRGPPSRPPQRRSGAPPPEPPPPPSPRFGGPPASTPRPAPASAPPQRASGIPPQPYPTASAGRDALPRPPEPPRRPSVPPPPPPAPPPPFGGRDES